MLNVKFDSKHPYLAVLLGSLLGLIVILIFIQAYLWYQQERTIAQGREQAKAVEVVADPASQLKNFDPTKATSVDLRERTVNCFIECAGNGDTEYYLSPYPGDRQLHVVDRILHYSKDGTSETKSEVMDMPLGVYWIEIASYDPTTAHSQTTVYGPYRVAEPLKRNCPDKTGLFDGQIPPCLQ